MVQELAGRLSIPGPDANLPQYIYKRMVDLQMRPTLSSLAAGIGSAVSTLRENLNGSKSMRLETAVKIADFLECDLTELVNEAGLR